MAKSLNKQQALVLAQAIAKKIKEAKAKGIKVPAQTVKVSPSKPKVNPEPKKKKPTLEIGLTGPKLVAPKYETPKKT